eukprot:354001-Chlamydomonas_euryale.AAC.8
MSTSAEARGRCWQASTRGAGQAACMSTEAPVVDRQAGCAEAPVVGVAGGVHRGGVAAGSSMCRRATPDVRRGGGSERKNALYTSTRDQVWTRANEARMQAWGSSVQGCAGCGQNAGGACPAACSTPLVTKQL